jgi:hypothetical protein
MSWPKLSTYATSDIFAILFVVKKTWRIVLALAAMVLVFTLWPAPKEPESQGKRLSQWLFQWCYPRSQSACAEAANALAQIGTNAVPCLLEWIQYQPGYWRMRMDAVRLRLSPKLRSSGSVSQAFKDWKEFKAASASEGFRILGQSAAAAVPDLTLIAKNSLSWEVSIRAMQALNGIGPSGLRGLTSIVADTNIDSRRRITAINQLPRSGTTNSDFVVNCLTIATQDKDPNVAAIATHVLGLLHSAPEISVPAIAKAYESPHASVRVRAVSALAEFGLDASTTTNVLNRALSDPDLRIQEAARAALNRVPAQRPVKPLQ